MKKKLSVLLLLVALVFSGNGCYEIWDAAEDAGFATFVMMMFFLNRFFWDDPYCGSCYPHCGSCSSVSGLGDAVPHKWSSTTAKGSDASAYYSTAAADGSVYAAGSITGSGFYDFGNGGLASAGYAGGTNAVLVKYEQGGGVVWTATTSIAPDNTRFYSVAAAGGGIYAAGAMDGCGNFSFGNGVTVSGRYESGSNALLVKYNTSGVPLWARSIAAGSDASSLYAVAAGSDGIYVSGYLMGNGTFDFGNGVTATGAGSGANAVIVKYDLSGTPLWARTTAAGPDDSSYLAVSSEGGYVFVAGYISGSGAYDFGDSKTVSGTYASGSNAVLAKYSSAGSVVWVKSVAGGAKESSFHSIVLAGDTVYAGGYITGNGLYDFGGCTIAGGGSGSNAVLVQYSVSGAARWARSAPVNPGDSLFTSVSSGSDGVYAAGFISGKLPYNFGNAVAAAGAYGSGPNAVVVKYSPSGTALWAKTAVSGSLESCFQSVSATDQGVYSAGYMFGSWPYDLGNGVSVIGSFSGSNCVLAKY